MWFWCINLAVDVGKCCVSWCGSGFDLIQYCQCREYYVVENKVEKWVFSCSMILVIILQKLVWCPAEESTIDLIPVKRNVPSSPCHLITCSDCSSLPCKHLCDAECWRIIILWCAVMNGASYLVILQNISSLSWEVWQLCCMALTCPQSHLILSFGSWLP